MCLLLSLVLVIPNRCLEMSNVFAGQCNVQIASSVRFVALFAKKRLPRVYWNAILREKNLRQTEQSIHSRVTF